MAKSKLRKQNIFNTTSAAIKFVAFWIMVVIQVPIIAILPRRWAVHYMPVFMWFLVKLGGIKIVVHGKLSNNRPLMVVSNHISVFEIATFPFVFRGSFVAKKEMENWPLVGWVAKKFGVRPSSVEHAIRTVIASCWDRYDHSDINRVAGIELEKIPTNTVFITMLVDYLRCHGE